MKDSNSNSLIRALIQRTLNVYCTIDPASEIRVRAKFLANYLQRANATSYVLGISGGIDSAVAGMLAQKAINMLKETGYDCKFIAVRLPYHEQFDEDSAQLVLQHIGPDETLVMNIAGATDAMMYQVVSQEIVHNGNINFDFVKGNIKARQRMIAQYAIAGSTNGLVIGTDHAVEALMGFFTKHGDGACDITPLAGLCKSQIRQIAECLGFPTELVYKVPTADLEDLDPGKPDESAFGVTYEQLDAYLTRGDVPYEVQTLIAAQYTKTMHKRLLPIAPC